jgi:outer membrane cobalamin receptor
MRNYGKVNITGIDLHLGMHIQTGAVCLWKINGTYTYQQVLDKTMRDTPAYNCQIPYTPNHAASSWLDCETPWANFSYTIIYSGTRYYEQINRPEYRMNAFSEHGITLSRTFRWKNIPFTLKAGCQNIFNSQYEVVRSYPMPGRMFRIEIKIEN